MNSGHGRISMPPDAEGGSFFGLGFESTVDAPSSSAASGGANNDASNTTSVDDLMKHYLQQCLSYHEEQLRYDKLQDESVEQQVTPIFVAGAVQQDEDLWQQSSESTQRETTPVDPSSISAAAQEAIAKARSIVKKLQTQHEQQQHEHRSDPEHHHQLLPPAEYARRRHAQLEKEKQRLKNALYKNFEYVSRREQERYQKQLLQLQQTRKMEIELQQQHAQQLLERQKQRQEFNKNQSLAGVGSTKRKQVEQQRQRTKQRQEEQDAMAASIYISGMPTDGSVDEEMLRALFGSYGALHRIHFYRNKQTKELKGDGLLLYSCDPLDVDSKQALLDTVCSQMNGAELPCGSILRVEPATSNYNDGKQPGHYGPAETDNSCIIHQGNVETEKQLDQTKGTPNATNQMLTEDAGEDLDDFFASLT